MQLLDVLCYLNVEQSALRQAAGAALGMSAAVRVRRSPLGTLPTSSFSSLLQQQLQHAPTHLPLHETNNRFVSRPDQTTGNWAKGRGRALLSSSCAAQTPRPGVGVV
jgi:hypothetical protein